VDESDEEDELELFPGTIEPTFGTLVVVDESDEEDELDEGETPIHLDLSEELDISFSSPFISINADMDISSPIALPSSSVDSYLDSLPFSPIPHAFSPLPPLPLPLPSTPPPSSLVPLVPRVPRYSRMQVSHYSTRTQRQTTPYNRPGGALKKKGGNSPIV
jgi:hypothetical protein